MISRDTLFGVSVHFPIARLKLKHAAGGFTDFELLSLLEPHKWAQNSVTVLRKVSGYDAAEVVVRPHP